MRLSKISSLLAPIFLLFCGFLHAEIETVRRPINYVKEVEYSGVGKLIIRQGDYSDLSIRGEPGLIRDTRVRIANGRVFIERKLNALHPPLEEIVCILTVREGLKKITLKGTVDLDSQDLILEDLEIRMGDLTTASVLFTGRDLKATVRDRAVLTMYGTAAKQKVLVEDFGNYLASDLESKICEVRIIGSGTAIVQADDELTAFVRGEGLITYTKTPKKLTQHVNGAGAIEPEQP